MTNLGQYLKDAREESNLTQAQVAKKLGLSSPQYISNVERGLCPVSVDQLAKLIPLYRLNPHQIVDIMVENHRSLLAKQLISKKRSASR